MSLMNLLGKAADTRWSIVLACLCFVFATGCFFGGGSDNNGNNGDNNGTNNIRNNGGNNGGTDAGDGGTQDDGGNGEDGGGTDGGGTDGGGDDGGGGDDTGNGTCTPAQNPPVDVVQCSILCQTGCDQQGSTCSLAQTQDGQSAFGCVATGSGAVGADCGADAACQEGLICANSKCREICRPGSTDAPQCTEGECRELTFEQNPVGIGGCFVTEDACQLLAGDCDAETSCKPTGEGNQCVANDGSASQGTECPSGPSQCPADFACLTFDANTTPTCRQLCSEQDQSCPDGTQCAGITSASGGDPQYFACVAQ
jgi:hypothetical protein